MNLVHYFKGISEIAGVELLLRSEGDPEIQLVILSRQNNKVQMLRSEYQITSFKQLKEKLAKDVPVALSVSGKGIIHRKLTTPLSPGNNKVNAVLPTANAGDFYMQEFKTEDASFLSLARKAFIDKTLNDLEKEGINVIALSLGPFTIELLLPLIETGSKKILSFGNHVITVSEQSIAEYQWTNEPLPGQGNIQLGYERINNQSLIAYSAAFQAILENDEIQIPIEKLHRNRIECQDKQLFKKTGIALLTVFLCLLLANFGLFMFFSPYTAAAPANLSDTETELASLRSEVVAKEAILQKLGWVGNSGISYMADQLAATVPQEINLTMLSLNPVDEQLSRQKRKPVFQNGIINVSGNCREVGELNQWVDKLKQLPFSALVSVTSYQYAEREKRGDFMLSITIR